MGIPVTTLVGGVSSRVVRLLLQAGVRPTLLLLALRRGRRRFRP